MNPEKLNEYRVFHLAAQAILPLIQEMHDNAYGKLMSKMRDGQKDLLADVARVEAIFTLKEDIMSKAKQYEMYATKE